MRLAFKIKKPSEVAKMTPAQRNNYIKGAQSSSALNPNSRMITKYGYSMRIGSGNTMLREVDKINKSRSKRRSEESNIFIKTLGITNGEREKFYGNSKSGTTLRDTHPDFSSIMNNSQYNSIRQRLDRQARGDYFDILDEQYRANWIGALQKSFESIDSDGVEFLTDYANSMSARDFYELTNIANGDLSGVPQVYQGELLDGYLQQLISRLAGFQTYENWEQTGEI